MPSGARRLIFTDGVLPTVSRMLAKRDMSGRAGLGVRLIYGALERKAFCICLRHDETEPIDRRRAAARRSDIRVELHAGESGAQQSRARAAGAERAQRRLP